MSWNEADHPRVPAGASEGGQFAGKVSDQARTAAGLDPIPEAVRIRYGEFRRTKFENWEPTSNHETAWLVDENGEILFKQAGKKSSVAFEDDQKEMMPGRYIIHNHNTESGLSESDMIFGWNQQVKGITAISPAGSYELIFKNRPEGGEASYELAKELKAEIALASEVIFTYHKIKVKALQMSAAEANSLHNHETLKAVISESKFSDYLEYRSHRD